jgi:hypothetical protein
MTGCQVASRPRDWFSRYLKWIDAFRTTLIYQAMQHFQIPSSLSILIRLLKATMDNAAAQI